MGRHWWSVDLETHDGAHAAAQMGGMACFIAAGLTVLGIAIGLMAHLGPVSGLTGVAGGTIETVLFVVAGLRLRAGKGAVWGIVAAVLVVIEIVMKVVTLTGIGGVIIQAGLLIGIVNGVRAAFALRRGIDDPDALAETFS